MLVNTATGTEGTLHDMTGHVPHITSDDYKNMDATESIRGSCIAIANERKRVNGDELISAREVRQRERERDVDLHAMQ